MVESTTFKIKMFLILSTYLIVDWEVYKLVDVYEFCYHSLKIVGWLI
jgi:hypothetical protein